MIINQWDSHEPHPRYTYTFLNIYTDRNFQLLTTTKTDKPYVYSDIFITPTEQNDYPIK